MTSRLRAYCMRQSTVRTWGLSSHKANDWHVPFAVLPPVRNLACINTLCYTVRM
jgi:hypothetical protein